MLRYQNPGVEVMKTLWKSKGNKEVKIYGWIIVNRARWFGNSLELQYKSLCVFVLAYTEMRSFTVTCVLYFYLTNQ